MTFRVTILAFAAGVAAGTAGTIYGPELIAPYLPEALQRKTPSLQGTVVVEKREGDLLFLRIQTQEGAILATFKEKVAATEILISEGDLITLRLRGYKPFVEDPVIARVRKTESSQQHSEPTPPLPDNKQQPEP